MDKKRLYKFSKEERKAFYQSKYEYYASFNFRLITVAFLSYLTFFITDCEIFDKFAFETVLPRFIVIVPFVIYALLYKFVKDYRILVTATYLMIHIIIWCTDWATYLLPDRSYAVPGMIIMNLIFVCAGFCAPMHYSVLAHLFLIVDIVIAHQFIHYENLKMMLLFNLPCIFAVCAMQIMMQRVHLEHYLTRDKLEQLVVHDQLTKVYNRNKIKELTNRSEEFAVFADINVSMLLVDIDHFKKVNDDYGHEAGDKVLLCLADILRKTVRETDFVIRWGGEEFLIIMPGCSATQAVRIAEKLRENVEKDNNGICPITVSVGVAKHEGGNYHMTIKNADVALYQAKNTGRNKVVLYQSELDKGRV